MNLNFTLVLQIISFLILLGLLTKFLYKPLITFLDERAREAGGMIENAKASEEKARRYAEETHRALEMAKQEAVKLRQESKEIADSERRKIIEESKKEARFLLAQAEQALGRERRAMIGEIRGQIATISVDIARKILGREISAKDHERLIEESISEIKNEISRA